MDALSVPRRTLFERDAAYAGASSEPPGD